jgi:tRNA-dihydrouridine synthase A
VQQVNETSIKGGKSRDKNRTRSHFFTTPYKDKLLNYKDKIFSVAPMMDWTDRHCRVFHRTLTRRALLYTEMVTALAVKHGDRQKLLGFDKIEHPVSLQLGGSDPAILAEAAKIGEDFGYDEVNLNVGCPSDRVQGGHFGACLMADPQLVADCVAAMKSAVKIPVTVKCRIGIDDQDEETGLENFINIVAAAGCNNFSVHARKAWLKGLSPKENREIPPLNYDRVYRLKANHPNLMISINGGIETLEAGINHLQALDGVMLGRAAYHNPWILAAVDKIFAGAEPPVKTRREAALAMLPYIDAQLAQGQALHRITRHMLGLYHAQPGGRIWRQIMTVEGAKPGAKSDVILTALNAVEVQAARLLESRAA